MKTTTRLYDIIYSYYNRLYGDFKRNNRIVYFDKDFQFTHKVVNYDDEVKRTCRDTIFYGLDFFDETTRTKFESEFLTRFLSRSIKFQTSSQFNLKLVSYCIGIASILTDYYTNMEKLARGNEYTINHSEDNGTSNRDNQSFSQTSGNDTSKNSTTSRTGNADVSLPQSQSSINLMSDEIAYADSISQGKTSDSTEGVNTSYSNAQDTGSETSTTTSVNDGNSETWKFDTNKLSELQQFHAKLFNELDSMLFSQIK